MQMKKWPMSCTCHAKRRFRPQNVADVFETSKMRQLFWASLRSRNARGHLRIYKIAGARRGPESVPWSNPGIARPLTLTVRTPQCGHTARGIQILLGPYMSLPIAQFALSKNGRKNFFSIWSGQEAHKVRQLDELDLRYSLRLGLKSYNKSIFALLGDRPKWAEMRDPPWLRVSPLQLRLWALHCWYWRGNQFLSSLPTWRKLRHIIWRQPLGQHGLTSTLVQNLVIYPASVGPQLGSWMSIM